MNTHTFNFNTFWTHECVWLLLSCTWFHCIWSTSEPKLKTTAQHKPTQDRTYFEYNARLFMLFHKRSDLFAQQNVRSLGSTACREIEHAMQRHRSSACHAMGADFIFVIKMKLFRKSEQKLTKFSAYNENRHMNGTDFFFVNQKRIQWFIDDKRDWHSSSIALSNYHFTYMILCVFFLFSLFFAFALRCEWIYGFYKVVASEEQK